MNWLYRLLGLDRKIAEAIETTTQAMEEKLQNKLAEAQKLHNEQMLKREAQYQHDIDQLQRQQHSSAPVPVAPLQTASPASPAEDALVRYFAVKLASNSVSEEEKRSVGRPKLQAKPYTLRLDLGYSLILEEMARQQHTSVARLVNECIGRDLAQYEPELIAQLQKAKNGDIIIDKI